MRFKNSRYFVTFFLLMSFVITCNFLLFLHFFELDKSELQTAALLTLGNIVLMTALFTAIDVLRRKETVDKPIKRIQEGIHRVINGDFSTKIEYLFGKDSHNEFDEIIGGLNKMIEELSSVETLRTDFISNVSHELKTPLAIIQNYGTLLSDETLDKEKQKEYSQAIIQQTKRLSSLITNILKLNKLENQQIFAKHVGYNLSEQLCECMLEFENLWEEKDIQMNVEIQEDVYIYADKELLSIVWNNLFSNALKFSYPKSEVSLNLYQDKDYVYISIKDQGCGMSEETGRNIFKKFYQGDTSHATEGNGLGLALVKRVIDICKGEISVSSELNKGTTFTVKLKNER